MVSIFKNTDNFFSLSSSKPKLGYSKISWKQEIPTKENKKDIFDHLQNSLSFY